MAAVEADAQHRARKHSHLVCRLHHGAEEGSAKRRVGEFLESTKIEIFILFLVVCDIALLGIEHGIDRHLICIEGNVAPLAPGPLVDLAEVHGAEQGSFLQASAGSSDVYGGGSHATFLSVGDVAPARGGRHASRDRAGDFGLDAPAEALVAESLLSPLALLGERVERHRAANDTAFHPERGLEEHGHEEHGHDEHGHGAHGHHHFSEALVCETRDGPNAHEIEHTCHMLSITILAIFLVEILAKIWVCAKEFFGNPFEVLDFIVVVLSLIVDVIILPMLEDLTHQQNAETVVMILMVCRLWRVVRIFHGLFEVVHHQVEEVHKLKERIEELEERLAERRGEKKPETKA